MRRIWLALTTMLVACPGIAATTAAPAPSDNAGTSPTQFAPVIVTAPEPRYVAATSRDRIGRVWAPVLINGKGPFRLVLDTGANGSAIVPSVAASLGISVHKTRKIRLQGVTGSAVVPVIKVDSLDIGDLHLAGTQLPIIADVFGGAEGVLGFNGLEDKRIFVDFGHDLIRISRSHNEPSAPGFSRVPIKLTRGNLLQFELWIGSIRTKAILDTGAQQTLGNNALREALLRRPRDGTDQTITGVTLDQAHGQSIAIPPIAIGGVEVRNMHVTFADMFIFEQWKMIREPAMLVGMDVLGSLDTLIIDYQMRELQLRPRR